MIAHGTADVAPGRRRSRMAASRGPRPLFAARNRRISERTNERDRAAREAEGKGEKGAQEGGHRGHRQEAGREALTGPARSRPRPGGTRKDRGNAPARLPLRLRVPELPPPLD